MGERWWVIEEQILLGLLEEVASGESPSDVFDGFYLGSLHEEV